MSNAFALSPIDRLLAIMRQLRNPDGGCAWDLAQDFTTISPYTIEEAYEVADAIASGIARCGATSLAICCSRSSFRRTIATDKASFRVRPTASPCDQRQDGTAPPAYLLAVWQRRIAFASKREQIKAAERNADGAKSVLDGVALSLPALLRPKAARPRCAGGDSTGPISDGPRAKIAEELEESKRPPTTQRVRRKSAICSPSRS